MLYKLNKSEETDPCEPKHSPIARSRTMKDRNNELHSCLNPTLLYSSNRL